MPNDLRYFRESYINRFSVKEFIGFLPSHLRTMFLHSYEGDGLSLSSVLQGYRGPHNNGDSGDSHYLGPCNGLQEVRYWWGCTKHLLWVPPTILLFALARITEDTNWHSLYFDSKTGECLSHNKNEAATKLNNKGHQLFQEGKYTEAKEYFNNAYQACSSSYKQTFKNDLDKAKVEERAANLSSEGDDLFSRSKYTEALGKYQEAYLISQISEECTKYQSYIEKAKEKDKALKLSKLDILWRKAWEAENDTVKDRSCEAKELFQKVLSEAKDSLKIFPDDLRFKQYESLVSIKICGNELFNEGLEAQQGGFKLLREADELKLNERFESAHNKYKEAQSKFSEAQEKFKIGRGKDKKFESCIDVIQSQLNEVLQSIEIIQQNVLSTKLINLDVSDDKSDYSEADSFQWDVTGSHKYYNQI